MIELLILAAIASFGATGATLLYKWPQALDRVTAWLRGRNESLQSLRKAIVRLDRFMTTVRSQLIVRSATSPEVIIDEEHLDISEIADPEVRAALRNRSVEVNLLST